MENYNSNLNPSFLSDAKNSSGFHNKHIIYIKKVQIKNVLIWRHSSDINILLKYKGGSEEIFDPQGRNRGSTN